MHLVLMLKGGFLRGTSCLEGQSYPDSQYILQNFVQHNAITVRAAPGFSW